MDIPTVPGAWYTVASSTTCEITDTATGTPLGTANAGSYSFQAQGNLTTLSDDSALYSKSNFKSAPAALMALGLLGGGASAPTLPAGFLAAEFLEAKWYARIDLQLTVNVAENNLRIETVHTSYMGTSSVIEGVFSNNNSAGMGQWPSTHGMLLNCGGVQAAGGSTDDTNFHTWSLELNGLNAKGWRDGELLLDYKMSAMPSISQYSLFSRQGFETQTWFGKKKTFKAWVGGEMKFDLVACVDASGVMGFFNKLNNEVYHISAGSDNVVIGFTLSQARQLGKLPAGGGALVITLPNGYEADAGVMSALDTARANGWTLTIQTYTPEASSSATTFALRRIWVRKTQDENGMYVAADGTRWQVDWCVDMLTPDGSEPDAHGYELFRSVDAAVSFWQLSPYVDPNAELFTDNP